jgi:hypothetical protein
MIDRNNEYKCKDIFTYKTSGNFVIQKVASIIIHNEPTAIKNLEYLLADIAGIIVQKKIYHPRQSPRLAARKPNQPDLH